MSRPLPDTSQGASRLRPHLTSPSGPPGLSSTGTAGDAKQQVRTAWLWILGQRLLRWVGADQHPASCRPFLGVAPSPSFESCVSPSGGAVRSWSPGSGARAWQGQLGECWMRAVESPPGQTLWCFLLRNLQGLVSPLTHKCWGPSPGRASHSWGSLALLCRMKRAVSLNVLNMDGQRAAGSQVRGTRGQGWGWTGHHSRTPPHSPPCLSPAPQPAPRRGLSDPQRQHPGPEPPLRWMGPSPWAFSGRGGEGR